MQYNYLLDTSIIIDSLDNVIKLSDKGNNKIIISEIVLNECDHLKTALGSVGYMARKFNSYLKDAEILGAQKYDNAVVTSLKKDDVYIDLIVLNEYKESFTNNYQNITNDRRIIESALWAKDRYSNLVVLTNDVGFKTYAVAKGLVVQTVKVTDDEIDLDFVREVVVPYGYLERLDLISVDELEKDLNISLSKTDLNIVFRLENSDHAVLAQVINGKVEVLDEESLRRSKLPPRNKEQLFYASAILHPSIDLVVSSSPSGSGKTALAVAYAMRLIDDPKTMFEKIVYIRNPIDSVDREAYIGFKKGDVEEKLGGYFTPIYDALDTFARREIKKSNRSDELGEKREQKIDEYIKCYNIAFPYIGNLRGSNLDRAVVIVDEAQNFSLTAMQLVLTRVLDSSKVVIIGDVNQVDSVYLSKTNNALSFLLNQTKEQSIVKIGAISLRKSIRGRICEWSEELFSRYKESKSNFS